MDKQRLLQFTLNILFKDWGGLAVFANILAIVGLFLSASMDKLTILQAVIIFCFVFFINFYY